ncbi:MAG: hypothetical protein ABMA25_25360, partial [Ilumatobacteraceae bacterium]
MFLRRSLLLLGLCAALIACSDATASPASQVPETLPAGQLPPSSPAPATTGGPTTVVRTTVPIPLDAQVGAIVGGNRVLLIGDSVMASTATRYSDAMCNALVPLGWQVEVDAETGRFIDFGDEVLDARLSAGWDVGVILLGNNYRDDQDEFRLRLEEMVQRLSPKPVVLLTVTEFTPSRLEVNQVIFDLAGAYDNVLIVDWGATTAADEALTGGDGLHLTDKGRAALAEQVALALGQSPEPSGKCLESQFDDDSSGPVEGTTTTTI